MHGAPIVSCQLMGRRIPLLLTLATSPPTSPQGDLLKKDAGALNRFLLPMSSLKQLSLQTDFTLSVPHVSIALGESDPVHALDAMFMGSS